MKNVIHTREPKSESLSGNAISRRKFLSNAISTVVGGYVMLAFPSFSFAAEANLAAEDIQKITSFLTDKDIGLALANRAYQALTKVDSQFPQRFITLNNFLASNQFSSVNELKDHPQFTGELKNTAQEVISALYLGYAGQPKAHSSEDNVEFVTYTQALTYQLTKDFTPIPSYSRLKTGYWAHLPNKKSSA
ncbi:sugar dehydrogenase complex small subunit [Vibrio viridaestus]|uniref:sugar dehydrogenase complex small subunit n=1 Tax=Vibrio viridaestus TaxID=2487322 RepID=UPI00140D9CB6|nr:sugar dehydrogenase complex small subunit [Vibrio viridaestus]